MPVVNNKMARVYRVDGVATFYPGLNQIDAEALKKCCAHPLFDARVVAGDLDIKHIDLVPETSPAQTTEAEPQEASDKRLSVAEMKELINATLNIPDLERLIEADQRKPVVAAARAQIARLRQEEKEEK